MARDMLCVTVVVVQEMQEEIPAERLGGQEIEKLVNLELPAFPSSYAVRGFLRIQSRYSAHHSAA